jgi:glycosyltransferase involved in cell wall biosynthesis
MIMIDWWIQQSIEMQIILIVFGAAMLFQILYYCIVFGRVAFFNPKKSPVSGALPSVSVIMVAENDYHNLRKNLLSVLEQDYPDFEVVIVNSTPQETASFYLLKSLEEKYPHLKTVDLPDVKNFYSKKKFLLAIGVKESTKDVLVFTNTDCQPDSPYWLRSMVSQMNGKKHLVLGYNGLAPTATLANRFYRLDRVNTSLTFLSLARCGMPYTGTGNNMACSRQLFNDANGLLSHYVIPYGEDTLFVNKNATRKNTATALTPDSLMRIQPKMRFKRWMYLKKIARCSQKHYKMRHRFVLTLFPFTRFVCYLSFIGLLCLLPLSMFYYGIIGVFALRTISQLIVTKKAMQQFHEKGLLLLQPLLEPVYMLLSWGIFFKALFRRGARR